MLGDFMGASLRLFRREVMDFCFDRRSASGVSGRLSGNSGKSSSGSIFGDAGLLGGRGRRSPY